MKREPRSDALYPIHGIPVAIKHPRARRFPAIQKVAQLDPRLGTEVCLVHRVPSRFRQAGMHKCLNHLCLHVVSAIGYQSFFAETAGRSCGVARCRQAESGNRSRAFWAPARSGHASKARDDFRPYEGHSDETHYDSEAALLGAARAALDRHGNA